MVSSIEYLNISSIPDFLLAKDREFSISNFSLAKDKERGWLFRLCTEYRKSVGEYTDVEIDFYSNNSLNDDLDNKF
jgi:hypothetical protein